MRILIVALLSLCTLNSYSDICTIDPRNAELKDLNAITLSTEHWTRIALPVTAIKGIEPLILEGLDADIQSSKMTYSNHLVIKATKEDYRSKIKVFGYNKIIILDVTTDKCGDSVVTINKPDPKKKKTKQATRPSEKWTGYKYLASYIMMEGKAPSGYRKHTFTEPADERRVMQTGELNFYVTEQYVGPKYICTIFEIVNEGRTSVPIPSHLLDFDNPETIAAFGQVHHAAVLPFNRLIERKPKRSEINHKNMNQNRGLLYIVSERSHGRSY